MSEQFMAFLVASSPLVSPAIQLEYDISVFVYFSRNHNEACGKIMAK